MCISTGFMKKLSLFVMCCLVNIMNSACSSTLQFNDSDGKIIVERSYSSMCVKEDSVYFHDKQNPLSKIGINSIIIKKTPHPLIMLSLGFIGTSALFVPRINTECRVESDPGDLFNEQNLCKEKMVGLTLLAAGVVGGGLVLLSSDKTILLNNINGCDANILPEEDAIQQSSNKRMQQKYDKLYK